MSIRERRRRPDELISREDVDIVCPLLVWPDCKVSLPCSEQSERYGLPGLQCGRADRDNRGRRLVRGPSSLPDLSNPEYHR